ncbi:A/G-specific adenine glycosylase [candidate division KSB1 bacterium]|nr:MAG: A/G-specific adenine glycosylase [candidate division KSB1 bacterium]
MKSESHPSALSSAAVRKLSKWYDQNQRKLPWRNTRNPYRIWISEILLQQTQVETVRPYFLRFIKAFPTLASLAAAPLDKVLKVWEGCGYYARARNLHRAAKQIVGEGKGFPRRYYDLMKLPGIGRYTAAAISSIAFQEPVAVLDGNVERVLARVLCERRVVKNTLVQKRLQRAADKVMQAAVAAQIKPGDLNQALMELGAIVCTPRRADCAVCPLKNSCAARRKLADVTILPRKTPAKEIPHYQVTAAILRKNGCLLITQRPHDGMLGGLWEFPGGKQHKGETLAECLLREIREELGIEIEVGELLTSVNHAYSHFKITLHAFFCKPKRGRLQRIGVADFHWVKPAELNRFAFPKADRVIIQRLLHTR